MAEVEQLRKSLDQFCSLKIDDTNTDNIPDDLQVVVDKMSSNGDMPFDLEWSQVSRIIRQRVLYCVAFMSEKRKYEGPIDEYEQTLKNILNRIEIFDEPPFTIQRVCELLQTPDKHYKSTDKYMRAIQRNLLVVSGWRKYVEDEVPDTEPEKESCKDEEESQAEPDSTSEPSTPAPHRSVSITHDVSYPEEAAAENASPDSTTIEEKPEERSFLERPKKKIVEEDDDDAFDQLVKLNASPQRKVALGTSKIQINVGSDFKKEVTDKEKPAEDEKPASTGNPEPQQQQVAPAEKMEDEQEEKPAMKVTESGDAPLPNEASSDLKTENKADEKEEAMSLDEKERKRKRPEADESEKSEEKDSDELEQPATPQKVQKTE